jgi:AcrR family transcriptional regulator
MPKINQLLIDEKRKFIIDVARLVFAEKGYQGATIKDILNAAGISNGALFIYFKSKQEILQTIVDQNLGTFCSRVDAIVKDSDGYSRDDVLLMLLELVRQISLGSGRAMSLHVWSTAMVDPVVKATLDKHFDAILHSLTQLARKLRDSHQLGPEIHPVRVANAMFSLFIPGYILQLLMFPAMEPRAYLNAHRDLWESNSHKIEKTTE